MCEGVGREEDESSSNNPVIGWIVRLAIEEEIGEGIEKNEKKEIKMEILKRAWVGCVSKIEDPNLVADIL